MPINDTVEVGIPYRGACLAGDTRCREARLYLDVLRNAKQLFHAWFAMKVAR